METLHKLIAEGDNEGLEEFLIQRPQALHQSTDDGHWALSWAWQYSNAAALWLLSRLGVEIMSEEDEVASAMREAAGTEFFGQKERSLCYYLARTDASKLVPDKAVYFVRHGYSAAQEASDGRGHRLSPKMRDAVLCRDGLRQAEELVHAVKRWPVEAVLCSPLRRAVQTAASAFAGACGGMLELDARLREWPVDSPENIGLELGEFLAWARSAKISESRLTGVERVQSGGERLWDPRGEGKFLRDFDESRQERKLARQALEQRLEPLEERLQGFFKDLCARQERVLAVVSHYTVIQSLFQDHFDARLPNCGVVKVRLARTLNGGWICGPPSQPV